MSYYTLDVGYSFIVEAARLAFPMLPDNHVRAPMLQLVVDAALAYFVFVVFCSWNLWLGLIAAYLYSSNGPFYDLVSFAYYYYWDIPLTFFVLGSLILAHHRPGEATLWLTLAALALGGGVWLRGSWWPLSLFLLAVVAASPVLRGRLLIPVLAFAVVATPQVVRSSLARGQLTFTTRAVWHVALVGLGYYANPYGLDVNDGVIFKLIKDKYGVQVSSQDYWAHEQAAKKEFASIWRQDRGFVVRSFLGRLKESVEGNTRTSVLSFLSVSNLTYRIGCLLGLVAMICRGGEKRLVGIAAAGMYAIYVVLTCVFYYVGLAYDNVSEVTLLVLFLGGLEAALYGSQHGGVTSWLAAARAGRSPRHSGLIRHGCRPPRHHAMLMWLRRVVIGAAIAATALQWANTRSAAFLVNQNAAHPLVLATYPIYHAMAASLREGRVGQIDLAALARYSSLKDLSAVYERLPHDARHEWVNYYTLDIGYSFIVEVARLSFPGLPDNHLRAIALQIVADAALVLFVFFIFSQWNLWLGLLAAFLYASQHAFSLLASFAYYYYWDIPLTFVVLGSIMLAFRRPASATPWLTLAGTVLGFGCGFGVVVALSVFLLGRGDVAGAAAEVARSRHRLCRDGGAAGAPPSRRGVS